jgi:hypothetical protein
MFQMPIVIVSCCLHAVVFSSKLTKAVASEDYHVVISINMARQLKGETKSLRQIYKWKKPWYFCL